MSVNEKNNPSNEEERQDDCLHRGLRWWQHFKGCSEGQVLLKFLPTREDRYRVFEIFQMGFVARWEICPPSKQSCRSLDLLCCLGLWEGYLGSRIGEVVLDGAAYPNTPPLILNMARQIFIHGFASASVEYKLENDW